MGDEGRGARDERREKRDVGLGARGSGLEARSWPLTIRNFITEANKILKQRSAIAFLIDKTATAFFPFPLSVSSVNSVDKNWPRMDTNERE